MGVVYGPCINMQKKFLREEGSESSRLDCGFRRSNIFWNLKAFDLEVQFEKSEMDTGTVKWLDSILAGLQICLHAYEFFSTDLLENILSLGTTFEFLHTILHANAAIKESG